MQVDKSRLNQKIAQLEQYIKDLRKMADRPKSEFESGSTTEHAAERRVYKAAQAALDIGGVLVADYGYGSPSNYRDVFVKLGKHGVINKKLQEKLEDMVGIRNVLAHGYAKVDPEQVYEIVRKDYQDLIEFVEAVESFVE